MAYDMHIPCTTCNRAESSSEWVKRTHYGNEVEVQYFCSEDCMNKSQSLDTLSIGFLILIATIFLNIPIIIAKSLPSNSFAVGLYFIINIFLIMSSVYLISRGYRHANLLIKYFPDGFLPNKWLAKKNNTQLSEFKKVDHDNNTIFVQELNTTVKICCYNAARLGDSYCMCGRGISYQLQEVFTS